MTFSTRNLKDSWADKTPDSEQQALNAVTWPVIQEWDNGDIDDDTLYDITSPYERSTLARFHLFDERAPTIRRMLDAIVAVDVRRNHLAPLNQGYITKAEAAEHGGHIRNGHAVFPEPVASPKPRRTRDVPF